jgi:hypothetical protein
VSPRRAAWLGALLLACTSLDDLAVEECDPTVANLDADVCNRLNHGTGCVVYQCDARSRRCVAGPLDWDRDGDPARACGGADCDDHNAKKSSHGVEICDGLDNDCNGVVDDGCSCSPDQTSPCDEDAAGTTIVWPTGSPVGECRHGTRTCTRDGRWGPCLGAVKPAPEVCDGKDNDCNGAIDDRPIDGASWYHDGDGDGHVSPTAAPTVACASPGPGWLKNPPRDDCNDADPTIFGGQVERCDGIDNNCNGVPDEGFTWNGLAVGSPCTVGAGACQRTGAVVCASPTAAGCSASPGLPDQTFHTQPADNGSWDWNCDGTDEFEYEPSACDWMCNSPTIQTTCPDVYALTPPCQPVCGGTLHFSACYHSSPNTCDALSILCGINGSYNTYCDILMGCR